MKASRESGSHLIGLALGLVAVGVIGFAGYRVWQLQAANVTTDTTATTVAVPKQITNSASLTQAAKALDQASTQLDASLDDSALNADLNDLL